MPLYPGSNTFPGPDTFPGGIEGVVLRVLIDLGNPTAANPNWQYLADDRVRSFSTSQGRASELSQVDAGTATLVVDNRDRAFDPTFTTSPYYPFIRPMTRFWLQLEINGTAYSRIVGYADSFDQSWPGGGLDAVCAISMTDYFKVLALEALPATSPPRDTYADVILADEPAGYWSMDEAPEVLVQDAAIPPAAAESPYTSITHFDRRIGRPTGLAEF